MIARMRAVTGGSVGTPAMQGWIPSRQPMSRMIFGILSCPRLPPFQTASTWTRGFAASDRFAVHRARPG